MSKFLQKRDGGNETNISHIILTDGASNGIHLVLNTILTSKDEGIMIPIPQYPLYSALIGLNQIHEVPYYLNEDRGNVKKILYYKINFTLHFIFKTNFLFSLIF